MERVRALAVAAVALLIGTVGAAAAAALAEASRGCAQVLPPSLLRPPPAPAAPLPRDLPAQAPYAPAALWLLQAGILRGDPQGLFLPEAPLTRAQLAVALARAAGPAAAGSGRPAAEEAGRSAPGEAARAGAGPAAVAPAASASGGPGRAEEAPAWAQEALRLAQQRGWLPPGEPAEQPVTWRRLAFSLLALTDNLRLDPDPMAAAQRWGAWSPLEAAGIHPRPDAPVSRGELAPALLAALVLPRSYHPALGTFRQPLSLLAQHHPEVYAAFRQVHPFVGCR